MPERIDDRDVFTLTEVANSIRKTIADRYTSAYWIKAEINKLNIYAKSGHCFPELVYKRDGVLECEMRATLWKNDFERINRNFLDTLKEPLRDGISVLMQAVITYEPKYGLSLVIRNIDPSFSLGELEREKRQTIDRLQKENLFGKNKLTNLSLLPKRIAIISIETSKGYQDFIKVVDQNIFGYRFFHMLFPALLQGDGAVKTIKTQLSRIKKVKNHFDAVAIIRGGGADAGLSAFNNYQLAKAICQFPLPVFTGIGHSTNLTVSEMVAFQNAITPTELGDFFLQKFHNFAVPLQRAEESLKSDSLALIEDEKRQFENLTRLFKNLTKNQLKELNYELKQISVQLVSESNQQLKSENQQLGRFKQALLRESASVMQSERKEIKLAETDLAKLSNRFFKAERDKLMHTEKVIQLVDPLHVVKRGYSLTMVKGKVVKSIDQLKEGDKLETIFADGTIQSTVDKKEKNNSHE